MNRPDLMALVGQRVTVTTTAPIVDNPVTGKLVALADQPTLILDLDDGRRMVMPQYRCKVTPTDEQPEPLTPAEELLDQQAATITRENTLVEQLDRMLANLQQHIERRAAELAQPLIDEAREAAAVEVKTAQGKQQRAEDLTAELRRHLSTLDRQRADYQQRAENARAHLSRNLAGLVGKSGYEIGYRDCANEITRILDTPSDLKEPRHG
ncbi:hypothetical protein AB0L05_27825 [Nonomuraea pusilla]|uniref:hypothetical protein n=1 Tax=Nonomuraea pusilla TaxID=46177 RepID=UPI00331AE744